MVGIALDAPPGARAGATPRRSVRSRVSAGHAITIVAGLVGALCTLAALRVSDHRVEVLVARRDLVPGTTIHADSFRTVRVDAGEGALAALVRAPEVDGLEGRV